MKTQDQARGRIMLAPMEGVVDPWIREILTSWGSIDFCVTEFIRVTTQIIPNHIFYDYAPELLTNSRTSSGTPVFVQLLGSDLNYMAENAFKAFELGAYGIDINFGCPAKTVNRHDGGSVLLKNPERVYQITQAVRKAVPDSIPVNAKVRLGYEHKEFHKEIAQAAESGGAGWLAVHARTKMDGYKPPAYWEFIKHMKNSVNIPVIANGEVWTVEDYDRCRTESECNDVMIGRGFMAEPLLAKMILGDKTMDSEKTLFELYLEKYILKYIDICPKKETGFLIGRTKQLVKLLSRNHIEFKELFESIKTLRTLIEIESYLKKHALRVRKTE